MAQILGTTWIVMGSSGSGKGTQATLLRNYLERETSGRVIVLAMGDLFRELWTKDGYSHELSREILGRGGLQPSFLQIYLWSEFLLKNISAEDHLVIDGSPRRLEDAKAMPGAFSFLGRGKTKFIHLHISEDAAKERIVARVSKDNPLRALEDNDLAKIESRLAWFSEHSMPAIDFFKNDPNTDFMEIDGEGTIESIHEDIIKKSFNL